MKFSDKTLTILKNFSSINQSLLFRKGNVIRTMSVMKNILAEATIDEELPKEFGIYELNQFLNGLSLHPDAELDFSNESYALIQDSHNNKTKYYFSTPSVIVSPPDKNMELPTQDICFQIDSGKLNQLLRASSVYQVPDLCAVGDGEVIKLIIRDKENKTSNEYSIDVGTTDKVFCMNYKVENIKIIPGKYDVVISSKGISKFTNSDYNLVYFIALEPDSTFE
jgi:hypothetical protein